MIIYHRLMSNILIVYDVLQDLESGWYNHRGRKCIIFICFKIRVVWRTRHTLLAK